MKQYQSWDTDSKMTSLCRLFKTFDLEVESQHSGSHFTTERVDPLLDFGVCKYLSELDVAHCLPELGMESSRVYHIGRYINPYPWRSL